MGDCSDIACVNRWNLCCGCGVCVAVCPKDGVLEMQERRGMQVAAVANARECAGCGLCGEVCPEWSHIEGKHEVFLESEEPFEQCFLGRGNPQARSAGASGGIITSLLCHLLESGQVDGAITVSFDEDNPTRLRATIAHTPQEVLEGAGSKYQTSTLAPAVKEALSKPERYAVVGLPCQIEAIHNACQRLPQLASQVVIKIALFCGHNATSEMTDFLLERLGCLHDDVKAIDYRAGKWRSFRFGVLDKQGTQRSLPMAKASPYRDLWEGMHFTPKACRFCPDFTGAFADISCGDAWLPELAGTDADEGNSLVLSKTSAGSQALESMVAAQKITLKRVERSALWRSNSRQLVRKKLHLKARLRLRQLFRRKPSFVLLSRQKGSLWWYLPSVLFDSLWPWIVERAYRRRLDFLVAGWSLTLLRNCRFLIERIEDRMAKPACLLGFKEKELS